MRKEAEDRDALKSAMEASHTQMAEDRITYARLVRKVGGKETLTRSGKQRRLINMLRQSCETLQMELSSGEPKCRIECDAMDERRSFSKRQETNLNLLAREIRAKDTFSSCVLSGFFKMGIAYIFTADASPLLFGTDNYVVPGKPGMAPVSFEDYGQDMTAKFDRQFAFQYHFFDVDYDQLTNGSYDQSVVKKLRVDKDSDYVYEGGEEHSARDAFGFKPSKSRLVRPRIRCVHIYRPDLKKGFVYPYKMNTPPLWDGEIKDPDGPYRTLKLSDLPDNTLPNAQAENLEPMDDLINSTARKMSMMVNQMRDIFVTEAGHEKDAKRQKNAKHGEYVVVDSLEGTEVRSIGGVNKNAAGALALLGAQYNDLDNNQRLRAGIGPTSPTATQDAQLGNANSGIAKRQMTRVLDFYADCFQGLRRRMWEDGSSYREAYHEHPRLPGVKVPAHWYPSHRVGEVDDYRCDVIPYTISYRSPEQQAAGLIATLNEIAPLMPQDRTLDLDAVVSDIAELRGQQQLLRWFQVVEPSDEDVKQDAQAPRNKVSTQIRRSESAAGAINPMQAVVAGME